MMKRNTNNRVLLGIISTIAASAAAYVALAYVRSGGRGQPSPLLPKTVEENLDKVTEWLDSRFGRAVVDRGMSAIQHALRGTGPDKLVQLLEQVFEPEDVIEHQGESEGKLDAKDKAGRFTTPAREN